MGSGGGCGGVDSIARFWRNWASIHASENMMTFTRKNRGMKKAPKTTPIAQLSPRDAAATTSDAKLATVTKPINAFRLKRGMIMALIVSDWNHKASQFGGGCNIGAFYEVFAGESAILPREIVPNFSLGAGAIRLAAYDFSGFDANLSVRKDRSGGYPRPLCELL